MDRKDFLKQMCLAGGVGGLTVLTGRSDTGQQADAKPDAKQTFAHTWVRALMENMEEMLSETERVELMEECGRDCARRGATAMAKQSQGNVDNLLAKLAGHLGKENARREGNTVFIVYDKCCVVGSRRCWRRSPANQSRSCSNSRTRPGAPNCRFEATIQA